MGSTIKVSVGLVVIVVVADNDNGFRNMTGATHGVRGLEFKPIPHRAPKRG